VGEANSSQDYGKPTEQIMTENKFKPLDRVKDRLGSIQIIIAVPTERRLLGYPEGNPFYSFSIDADSVIHYLPKSKCEADFVLTDQAPAPKYEPVVHGEVEL
jgi:hypothetical protein